MKPVDLVRWELEYSVDVIEIDAQHRELMNMVNDMIHHSTESPAKTKAYLEKAIYTAGSSLAKHFDTEERILNRTNYDKLVDHKKEHENLTSKVKAIFYELGSNSQDIALYDLTVTLKEYFLSHILLYDKAAMEFFKAGSKVLAYSDFQSDFQAGII